MEYNEFRLVCSSPLRIHITLQQAESLSYPLPVMFTYPFYEPIDILRAHYLGNG